MRVEPTEGRAFPIPFFELIPKKRARGRAPRRTSVQWRNYNAESEVLALPLNAYRCSPSQHTKHPTTNGVPNGAPNGTNGIPPSAPRAGIFSRLSARLSTAKPERPLFPHKSVERVADEAPMSKVEPPRVDLPKAEPSKTETLQPETLQAERLQAERQQPEAPKVEPPTLPTEPWTTPEAAVTPDMAAFDERAVEIPEAAEARETTELPERAELPETAESVEPPVTAEPPDSVESPEMVEPPETAAPTYSVEVPSTVEAPSAQIPQDLPDADHEPVHARTVTEATYQAPPDEIDTLFTEWRPDAAGHARRHFLAPGRWSISGSMVKRAIAAALVLGAGYIGVQRVRADRASRQSVATGGVAAQQERTEDVTTGRLEEAATARPTGGGFTEAERDEVRSALARVGESRAVLAAHLDTLANTLSGAASDSITSDSSAVERCTHAGALYQRSLDDIARIDLARKKLTSLVGPMRMAGIDSLSTITSDLHQRLRELCSK
jgi:hypothetical protein